MWKHLDQLRQVTTRAAMGLLFPPACCLCDAEIEPPVDGVLLCCACRPAFEPATEVCLSCAAPIAHGGARGERCWRCIEERMRFEGVAALGVYEGQLAKAARLMKLPQQTTLTLTAGRLLAEQVAKRFAGERFDLIAPAPMHWLKQSRRGVNAAALLAEEVSRNLMSSPHQRGKHRCALDLLRWNRWAEGQHRLSPWKRRRNLRGACSVSRVYDVRDAVILLVDDTLTTGATANEITRALHQAGAARVAVAVVARGIGR